MNPALKNGILIVVVVLAIGGAIFMFTRGSGPELPTDDEFATRWMDEETQEKFTLSPAKLLEWQKTPGKLRTAETGGGGAVMMGQNDQMVFLNEKTQKYSIVRAYVHGPTGNWYIEVDSKGRPVPPPQWLIDYEQQQQAGGG